MELGEITDPLTGILSSTCSGPVTESLLNTTGAIQVLHLQSNGWDRSRWAPPPVSWLMCNSSRDGWGWFLQSSSRWPQIGHIGSVGVWSKTRISLRVLCGFEERTGLLKANPGAMKLLNFLMSMISPDMESNSRDRVNSMLAKRTCGGPLI